MVAITENLTVNEYTSVGGTGYAYDANGNLISDGTYSFEYDAFNRLVRVKQAATTVAEYLYDAANRRVKKAVGYEEYQYVYGGWQVLEEYYSVPAKEYFDNLYRRFTYGEYIDEPVVMECDRNFDEDFGDTNEVLYYAQNNTYNVAALFDASGDVVEHYRYDPYGKATIYTGKGNDNTWFTSDDVSSSTSAVNNPYTFTGRRLDDETGLMYFRNRYYSTTLGRFISRDAMEYVDGWNLYRGYFAVNGVDAWGLYEKELSPFWKEASKELSDKEWGEIVDAGLKARERMRKFLERRYRRYSYLLRSTGQFEGAITDLMPEYYDQIQDYAVAYGFYDISKRLWRKTKPHCKVQCYCGDHYFHFEILRDKVYSDDECKRRAEEVCSWKTPRAPEHKKCCHEKTAKGTRVQALEPKEPQVPEQPKLP